MLIQEKVSGPDTLLKLYAMIDDLLKRVHHGLMPKHLPRDPRGGHPPLSAAEVVTQQQKVVPYVVEIDELGVARYVKEVQPQAVHEPLVVSADLGQYLKELRTITPDRRLLREQTTLAWRRSLPPAQQTIRAFYAEQQIDEILQKGRILPKRVQVTPLSEKTYRAVWVDEFTGLDGTLLTEVPWEATIEVALIVPWELSVEERKLSPLGIFVQAITWHPV